MAIILDRECPRCQGSGEIAVRVTFPMTEVGSGPVPDYARGVTARKCTGCDGAGVVEIDLEEECE